MEETLLFSQYGNYFWYFPQCGKYNLNFPHCGNYNVDFLLCGKNGFKFSAKLEVKYFMFHNVQREHKAVKALFKMVCNWILYSVDLVCPKMTKSHSLPF